MTRLQSSARTRPMSEVDLAAQRELFLLNAGVGGIYALASERPVVLPSTGERAVPDFIVRATFTDAEFYGISEGKLHLDDELVEQAIRWIGFAHCIETFFLADAMTRARRNRVNKLAIAGIAAFAYDVASEKWFTWAPSQRANRDADTQLIEAAFHAGISDLDAPAGSSAARRQTQAKSEWTPDTLYLREHGPQTAAQLNRALRKNVSADARRKAIIRKEWLGVDFDDQHPKTMFFAEAVG